MDSCKQTSKRFAETFVIQTFMASCSLFGIPFCTVTWSLGTDENALYKEKTHNAFSSALQNSHDFFMEQNTALKEKDGKWKIDKEA